MTDAEKARLMADDIGLTLRAMLMEDETSLTRVDYGVQFDRPFFGGQEVIVEVDGEISLSILCHLLIGKGWTRNV